MAEKEISAEADMVKFLKEFRGVIILDFHAIYCIPLIDNVDPEIYRAEVELVCP
jgi:hypothetical protein